MAGVRSCGAQWQAGRHGETGFLTLKLFELELQLPDLLVECFRGAAKMHPPQPRDLQLQLLDLVLTRQQEGLG